MTAPQKQDNVPPDKLSREIELLEEISHRPFPGRTWGYIKLTGPGLLQSALTLGAGSAAASVIAGSSFGYKLLWMQPLAMCFGIMMFFAISNIVLTTRERPYAAFMRELGSIRSGLRYLVVLWAIGTVMASVIWHFPQYGLAAGAVRSIVQEFVPGAELVRDRPVEKRDRFGFENAILDPKTGDPVMVRGYTPLGYAVSWGAGIVLFLINAAVVFNYGKGGVRIRIYEWFLRCVIGLVVVIFFLVVFFNCHKIDWLELFRGFTGYYGIPTSDDPKENAKTTAMVLGILGSVIGINMTFLYPYTLLKKGWGTEHKTLVRWDIVMTMLVPYSIVTSLIIVALTVSGVYDLHNVHGLRDVVNMDIDPIRAASALQGEFISQKLATVVFCSGLIGMSCGAISVHMACCGFTFCEMLGLEHTPTRFRLFALVPSVGIFGVVTNLPFWFPVAASAVCLTMLPVAYIIIIVLNNRRSYIGSAVGKGWSRFFFNAALILTLIVTLVGAAIQIKSKVVDPLCSPEKEGTLDPDKIGKDRSLGTVRH